MRDMVGLGKRGVAADTVDVRLAPRRCLTVWQASVVWRRTPVRRYADKSRRSLGPHCLGFGEVPGGWRGCRHHGNAEPCEAGMAQEEPRNTQNTRKEKRRAMLDLKTSSLVLGHRTVSRREQ
jgi:hypothetical protein